MHKTFSRLLPVILSVLIIFTLVQSTPVQAELPVYENQVLIVPYSNLDEIAYLGKRYDVVEVDSERQEAKIFSNQITRDALAEAGFSWTIDQEYTLKINTVEQASPWQISGIPSRPCFRTIGEVYASANNLVSSYPTLVEKIDIGDSWEKTQNPNNGWDMEVVLLTNRNNEATEKSDVFIMSSIHAREWATAELNLRLAEYLLQNYNINPDVKWLLDYNRIHLVLVTNPDGRLQDEANTNWLWRKNTNTAYCPGQQTSQGYGPGADLNRNFPYHWSASNDQCDPTHAGASAGSEPETQAITTYVASIFPDQKGPNPNDRVDEETATGMFIDLHSYSRLVLWPWGYTTGKAPNDDALKMMSYKFAYYNGHDPKQSSVLYPTDGSTDDFAYGELGVPGFCFEVGDEFHESCSKFENDINPRNIQALLRAVKIARLPYKLAYGPEVTALKVSTAANNNLIVTYTADDTLYSNYKGGVPSQKIAAIRYSFDMPSWISGSNAKIIEITNGKPVYDAMLGVSAAGLAPGNHTLFFEAMDSDGNWGPPTAINLTINASTTPTPIIPTPTPVPGLDLSIYLPLIER
jgi:murein tripeptide amidase MpaA